jgi:quinohemoprotein ethanol dehydrogenase
MPAAPRALPDPPPETASADQVIVGRHLYAERCAVCHGLNAVSSGLVPDLRFMDANAHKGWDAVLLYGAKRASGMPSFDKLLSPDETDAVHAYVIKRAWDVRRAAVSASPGKK